jgi:hypothetical protein
MFSVVFTSLSKYIPRQYFTLQEYSSGLTLVNEIGNASKQYTQNMQIHFLSSDFIRDELWAREVKIKVLQHAILELNVRFKFLGLIFTRL